MRIGVPKEIKANEYRVGLTPESVAELAHLGHQVYVEANAGNGIRASDAQYRAVGAEILPDAAAVFGASELIVKVKEPQLAECAMLQPRHVVFTYLHLAANPELTRALMASGCAALAYETVSDAQGGLPLLAPMSEVAGRLSIQAGAYALQSEHGGVGILLGGVAGVPPAHVVIIGGGVVGSNAAQMALGLGARVTVLDKSVPRLRDLEMDFDGRVETLYATKSTIESSVRAADLVVGAVLVPGASAPKLVSEALIKQMKPGSVVVDVAIDQGGCFATSHATTHAEPTFIVDGVVHYCVANMPGAVPRTSTYALNNATLPFITELAELGWVSALAQNAHLRDGLNIYRGEITQAAVAASMGLPCCSAAETLSAA